MAQQRTLIYT